MRYDSSRRLILFEEPRVPRILQVEHEARSPFAERGDRRVEHPRLCADFSFRSQRRESITIDGLYSAVFVAIENQSAVDQARAEFGLHRFQSAKESVDRATRCARRRLIDRDGEEPAVAPVSGNRELVPVRL